MEDFMIILVGNQLASMITIGAHPAISYLLLKM